MYVCMHVCKKTIIIITFKVQFCPGKKKVAVDCNDDHINSVVLRLTLTLACQHVPNNIFSQLS